MEVAMATPGNVCRFCQKPVSHSPGRPGRYVRCSEPKCVEAARREQYREGSRGYRARKSKEADDSRILNPWSYREAGRRFLSRREILLGSVTAMLSSGSRSDRYGAAVQTLTKSWARLEQPEVETALVGARELEKQFCDDESPTGRRIWLHALEILRDVGPVGDFGQRSRAQMLAYADQLEAGWLEERDGLNMARALVSRANIERTHQLLRLAHGSLNAACAVLGRTDPDQKDALALAILHEAVLWKARLTWESEPESAAPDITRLEEIAARLADKTGTPDVWMRTHLEEVGYRTTLSSRLPLKQARVGALTRAECALQDLKAAHRARTVAMSLRLLRAEVELDLRMGRRSAGEDLANQFATLASTFPGAYHWAVLRRWRERHGLDIATPAARPRFPKRALAPIAALYEVVRL